MANSINYARKSLWMCICHGVP